MTLTHDPALHFARLLASRPEIRRAGVPRTLKKGGQVFRDDDADRIFVLEHGLIKLCFIPPDGKEWIRSFVAAPGAFGMRYLQTRDETERGDFLAICLENCTLVAYPYDLLNRLGGEDPEVARAGLDLIHHYTMQRERRWRNMLSLSTEKAYRAFLEEHPDIATRITQADTARYLGITPVALSRIRGHMDH